MPPPTAAPLGEAEKKKRDALQLLEKQLKREEEWRDTIFKRAVAGANVPWGMDAAELAAFFGASELMEKNPHCTALLEKMRGATGLDLVNICLDFQEKPPWVKLQNNFEGKSLKKELKVPFGQIARLNNFLNSRGLGFAALLYQSCDRQSQLMDFHWVRKLGTGGYGEVHEMTNRHLSSDAPHVALKLIKVKYDEDDEGIGDDEVNARQEDALAHAVREMSHHQRAAQSSEFIVNIHNWAQVVTRFDDHFLWVSMELCVGGDVAQLLHKQLNRGIEAELRWKLFEQITQGIEAIHENRLFHMDIKPENSAFPSFARDCVCVTLLTRAATTQFSSLARWTRASPISASRNS